MMLLDTMITERTEARFGAARPNQWACSMLYEVSMGRPWPGRPAAMLSL